jgi:hypothetical protein
VLLTGLANIWTGYAAGFLQLLASVYPGYDATGAIGDVATAALYAVVDAGVMGAVLAWLYNRLSGGRESAPGRRTTTGYDPVEPEV